MAVLKTVAVAAVVAVVSVTALTTLRATGKEGACAEDVKTHCANIEPGRGAIGKCLAEHESELSQACLAEREQALARRQAVAEACREDAQKHCLDARKSGPREIAKCLASHRDDLSEACRTALTN